MKEKYIIDVNLPYYFNLWNTEEYTHQLDVDSKATDQSIWEYATANNLTIVTKDSDFSNRILITSPPPRVIHIKFGNMKMKDFHSLMNSIWNKVIEASKLNKLVNVYHDQIEGID
ncbi:MAG: putative nuclease of putative toxin-antitoxin system [Bacteroidia bacterium]|jgi:predicted nuclease of predicted toxin-antitoxin system